MKAADTILQERFKEHGFSMDAFSGIQYIGTQTVNTPTDFSKMKKAVTDVIENSSVRSYRPVSVIYQALKVGVVVIGIHLISCSEPVILMRLCGNFTFL